MLNTSLATWLKLAKGNFVTTLGPELLATASDSVQFRCVVSLSVLRLSSVNMALGHESVLARIEAKLDVIANLLGDRMLIVLGLVVVTV